MITIACCGNGHAHQEIANVLLRSKGSDAASRLLYEVTATRRIAGNVG